MSIFDKLFNKQTAAKTAANLEYLRVLVGIDPENPTPEQETALSEIVTRGKKSIAEIQADIEACRIARSYANTAKAATKADLEAINDQCQADLLRMQDDYRAKLAKMNEQRITIQCRAVDAASALQQRETAILNLQNLEQSYPGLLQALEVDKIIK